MKVFKIDKYVAYYLGYLWADGHVNKKYTVSLKIVKTDYEEISDVIKQLNIKNIKFYNKKSTTRNCKPVADIVICSVRLNKVLSLFDYRIKSNTQPIKILNKIPVELYRYFYLGLFDGDGSFYVKNNKSQFSYYSVYDQNYTFIENLYAQLDIKSSISRTIAKNGSGSGIRITNNSDISKLIHYLYPTGYEFGLFRKYNKTQKILNIPHTYRNKRKNTKENIINSESLSIEETMLSLNCTLKYARKLKSMLQIKNNISIDNLRSSKKNKYREDTILLIHNLILCKKTKTEICSIINDFKFYPHDFYKSIYNQITIKKHFGNFYDYTNRTYIV